MTTNGCGYDTSNDDARSVTKHERSNTIRIRGSKDRYRGCKREEVGGCEKKRRKRTRPSVGSSSDELSNVSTKRSKDFRKSRAIDEMRLVFEGNYANPWRRTARETGTKGSRAESEKLASRFHTKYAIKKGECEMQRDDEWVGKRREGKRIAEEDSKKVFGEGVRLKGVGRKGEDAANRTKKQSEEASGYRANEE